MPPFLIMKIFILVVLMCLPSLSFPQSGIFYGGLRDTTSNNSNLAYESLGYAREYVKINYSQGFDYRFIPINEVDYRASSYRELSSQFDSYISYIIRCDVASMWLYDNLNEKYCTCYSYSIKVHIRGKEYFLSDLVINYADCNKYFK